MNHHPCTALLFSMMQLPLNYLCSQKEALNPTHVTNLFNVPGYLLDLGVLGVSLVYCWYFL